MLDIFGWLEEALPFLAVYLYGLIYITILSFGSLFSYKISPFYKILVEQSYSFLKNC